MLYMEYSNIFIKSNGVQYQESMKFKILSVAIMVAATLTALASTPLTTPAYAGGNVHTDNKVHVHNNDVDCQPGGNIGNNACNLNVR